MYYQANPICSAGGSGVTSLPAGLRERDSRAYSQLLSESSGHWVLLLTPRPTPEGNSKHYLQWNKSVQAPPPREEDHRLWAGEQPTAAERTTSSGLLAMTQDWELRVDLGKQLRFPETIITTTLRLDMLLISKATKQVILIKLTIP